MEYLINFIALKAEGETEVLVAGDPEKRHMEKCNKEGGIRYHPNQIVNAVNKFINKEHSLQRTMKTNIYPLQ